MTLASASSVLSTRRLASRVGASLVAALVVALAACGGSSNGGSGGAGGGAGLTDCTSSPLDANLQTCTGLTHRVGTQACHLEPRPPTTVCMSPNGDVCNVDADCNDAPYGQCNNTPRDGCQCSYGCVTDSDCSDGEVCLCGQNVGHCATASCTTDDDCNKGYCAVNTPPGCSTSVLVCQPGAGYCGAEMCADGEVCTGSSCTPANQAFCD